MPLHLRGKKHLGRIRVVLKKKEGGGNPKFTSVIKFTFAPSETFGPVGEEGKTLKCIPGKFSTCVSVLLLCPRASMNYYQSP